MGLTQTLTFCFSDIEGSTRLWEENALAMSEALALHDRILREQIEGHSGSVFKTVGDGFYATFDHAHDAVAAALQVQLAIAGTSWPTSRPIRVRMALHTGPAEVRDNDFFGNTLNRVARLLSTGYGAQILLSQSTTALVRDFLPAGAQINDLGLHRLKDLDTPERIGSVWCEGLELDFPPLKSLDVRPNNLPKLLSTFIGRVKEREEVCQFLAQGPLLTLVGAGGTGKTRLSIEVGRELLDEYSEGVWFVDLTEVRDEFSLMQTVANALGIREVAQRSLKDALVIGLGAKRSLLILDNCEQILAPAAKLVKELLGGCSNLSILATSREPLRIGGEQVFRVPSLSAGTAVVKSVAKAMELDAVRLLVDRCRLSDPKFELAETDVPAAVQICRQLDGIPFAIELAASRLKVLKLRQIADRLRDRFKLLTTGHEASIPRQQTLRATIDWSYELLNDSERELLGRISVFSGGWTMEAAEAICPSETLESWDVLDGLMRLVDKSLVVRDTDSDETRFTLSESVRQYAMETVRPETWPDLRRTHARYFAAFAVEAEGGIQGTDQAQWLERVELEHDNLRAVFAWAKDDSEILTSAFQIAGAIGRFWTVRGHYSEGRALIEALLAIGSEELSALRANAFRTAGQLAYWQGDSEAGRRFGEESLKICRAVGDQDGEARSLFRLGFACLSEGDYGAARRFFEDGLVLARKIGDDQGIPHLENGIGEAAAMEGHLVDARARFESALAGFKRLEDQRSIASVLKNLANIAIAEGKLEEAQRCLMDSLSLREGLGNPTGIAVTLDSFSVLAASRHQLALAVFLMAAAHAIHQEMGSRPEPGEAARSDEIKAEADIALGRDLFDQIWSRGSHAPLEEVLAWARGEIAAEVLVADSTSVLPA